MTEQEARSKFSQKMTEAWRWWRDAEQTSNPDTREYAQAVGDSIADQARREARAWKEQRQ